MPEYFGFKFWLKILDNYDYSQQNYNKNTKSKISTVIRRVSQLFSIIKETTQGKSKNDLLNVPK